MEPAPAELERACYGVPQSTRATDQHSGGGDAPHRSDSDDEHGAGAHPQDFDLAASAPRRSDIARVTSGGIYLDAHRHRGVCLVCNPENDLAVGEPPPSSFSFSRGRDYVAGGPPVVAYAGR
jgi:hypothetical protein